MSNKTAGWKFESSDSEEGFEFAVKGGSNAVKKLADIMENVERDMKAKQ